MVELHSNSFVVLVGVYACPSLVAAGGVLIAVNNSLYLSGRDFQEKLESICDGKYLALEKFIPIPEDYCFKCDETQSYYPADPAPFNHPTKIAVLRVL